MVSDYSCFHAICLGSQKASEQCFPENSFGECCVLLPAQNSLSIRRYTAKKKEKGEMIEGQGSSTNWSPSIMSTLVLLQSLGVT